MNEYDMQQLAGDFSSDDQSQSISDLYLIFHLGDEDYGLEVANITEIVSMQNVTKVPDMPPYVIGVINLRGQVIPVIDVRIRFGLDFREYDDRTCAIVVSIDGIMFGLIVDVVDEVMSIQENMISPPPSASFPHAAEFIKGIGRVEGEKKVKILLDSKRLLNNQELDQLA